MIVIVEIFHSGEGGDVEQACSNLETNLSCLQLLNSLSQLNSLFISYILINYTQSYMQAIISLLCLCLIVILVYIDIILYNCTHLNQESNCALQPLF